MTPRETENNADAKFWGDKEHYGMFWYFLEWAIFMLFFQQKLSPLFFSSLALDFCRPF